MSIVMTNYINEVLLTSFSMIIIGCIGLVKSNTLLKNIVSIEIITLSSLLMLLSYKNSNNNVLLVLIIITISELNFAILFNINHKLNSV